MRPEKKTRRGKQQRNHDTDFATRLAAVREIHCGDTEECKAALLRVAADALRHAGYQKSAAELAAVEE